jgi:HK97 family phage portal protein
MGWFSRRRDKQQAQLPERIQGALNDIREVMASAVYGQTFEGDLKSEDLADFMRGGSETYSGAVVSSKTALRNAATFRAVDLISSSVGMLPTYLKRLQDGDVFGEDKDHPLYNVLLEEPNANQTAFEFKSTMQLRALTEGNAYAYKMESGSRVIGLEPLDVGTVTAKRDSRTFEVQYEYRTDNGGVEFLPRDKIFHLRGLSSDGVLGLSRTRLAKEAIGLALQAERKAARRLGSGAEVGGIMGHPGKLSPEAYDRLTKSLNEIYTGVEGSGNWLIAEEGMEPKPGFSAKDDQQAEIRAQQVEEIARIFGVPRPLLMVDETSWGSGIEQLGMLFIRYGLAPWFTAWEQAIKRSCLRSAERRTHKVDFDETMLLRGLMKDQGEFFARSLGSGGHPAWMTQNEVRRARNLPPMPGGDELKSGQGIEGGAQDVDPQPAEV